jgi:hypothetical protein
LGNPEKLLSNLFNCVQSRRSVVFGARKGQEGRKEGEKREKRERRALTT